MNVIDIIHEATNYKHNIIGDDIGRCCFVLDDRAIIFATIVIKSNIITIYLTDANSPYSVSLGDPKCFEKLNKIL